MVLFALMAAQAVVASNACVPSVSQSDIDRVEDRAFAAMKSASEQVANAARSGAVGSAGDAEWASYKALRAQAETMRLQAAREAAGCQAPVLAQAAPRPSEEVVAALPVAEPAPDHSRSDKHFTIGFKEGAVDYGIRSPINIPVTTSTGTIPLVSNLAVYTGSPPPFSSLPINRVGSPQITSNTTVPGPQLSANSWSNNHTVFISYKPSGENEAGWRFTERVNEEDFHLKQYLGGTITAAAPQMGQASSVQFQTGCFPAQPFPPFNCGQYVATAPFTEQRYVLNGFGPIGNQISFYNIDQSTQSARAATSAAYEQPFNTPLGRIKLSLGGSATAAWYRFKQSSSITYGETASFLGQAYSITDPLGAYDASGPGFRGTVDLKIAGQFPYGLPLKWRLFGSKGVEYVDLRVSSPDQNQNSLITNSSFSRSKDVSEFGAGLDYIFLDDLALQFDVSQRKDFYISVLSGTTGTSIGQGQTIDLRTAEGVLYSLGLAYSF